jgi:hypothetical protein
MRHFKVDFEWKKKYSSKEFKIACEKYDELDIISQPVEFDSNKIQQIFISELKRSYFTYKALKLEIKTNKTELINEVPIVPFIETKFKLPTPIWMIMGRIQWLLNIKKQPEVRNDTLIKIETLIQRLEIDKKDTLIIGHGFYFSQLKRVLKKMRYSGSGKSHYKNGKIIIFKKY